MTDEISDESGSANASVIRRHEHISSSESPTSESVLSLVDEKKVEFTRPFTYPITRVLFERFHYLSDLLRE